MAAATSSAPGAMLCELLTGHRPFHGESLVTILFKITHEEPRLELPPGPEHEALVPILKKALAKDVADRYQTAAEFVDALHEYQAAALPRASGAAASRSASAMPCGHLLGSDRGRPRPGDRWTSGPWS